MKNILKISTLVLATMLFASVTNVQGQVISISVTDQHSPGPYGNGNTKYVAQWIIQDVNTLAYPEHKTRRHQKENELSLIGLSKSKDLESRVNQY